MKRGTGVYPYWFPAKRDVPRSNKHSIEVVVQDENSPVEEHYEVDAASCSVQRPVPDNGIQNCHGGAYSNNRQGYDWPPVAQSPNLMEALQCHKS